MTSDLLNIVMITLCPYCGHLLPRSLANGITSCTNCNRVFESSIENKLLGVAWIVKRKAIIEPDYLVFHYGVSRTEAEMVIFYIDECCYSHEEFARILKEADLSEWTQRELDAIA